MSRLHALRQSLRRAFDAMDARLRQPVPAAADPFRLFPAG